MRLLERASRLDDVTVARYCAMSPTCASDGVEAFDEIARTAAPRDDLEAFAPYVEPTDDDPRAALLFEGARSARTRHALLRPNAPRARSRASR